MEAINDIKSEMFIVASAIAHKQHDIDVLMREKAELEQRKSALETELARQINAPSPDGTDLTLKLPAELLINIVLLLSTRSIFSGVAGVCRRWRRFAASTSVEGLFQREIQLLKYAAGYLQPTVLDCLFRGHEWVSWSLAMSADGRLYLGTLNGTIRVWSCDDDYAHLHTLLEGRTIGAIRSLAISAQG